MKGSDIKKLLKYNDIKLNKKKSFDDKKIYDIDEIPSINVDKNILFNKLCEYFDENISQYIILQTYKNNIEKIDPKKILQLIKIE